MIRFVIAGLLVCVAAVCAFFGMISLCGICLGVAGSVVRSVLLAAGFVLALEIAGRIRKKYF